MALNPSRHASFDGGGRKKIEENLHFSVHEGKEILKSGFNVFEGEDWREMKVLHAHAEEWEEREFMRVGMAKTWSSPLRRFKPVWGINLI